MVADWINSLTARLEQANPETGEASWAKATLSAFLKTFVTKGIVKTPMNFVWQTAFERSPIGLTAGLVENIRANVKGVEKLTNDQANTIHRLLKVGAVGTAMYVWGAIDATKKPKDRIFGGYYQPGDKRDPNDVGFSRMRIAGWETPTWVHFLFLEPAQMGNTMMRVATSKLNKKSSKTKGVVEGAVASVLAAASAAPVVNPITNIAEDVERHQAEKVLWDEVAGLIPMLSANIATDLDQKSRSPKTFAEDLEEKIPGLRQNVPETKAQKKKDAALPSRDINTTFGQ